VYENRRAYIIGCHASMCNVSVMSLGHIKYGMLLLSDMVSERQFVLHAIQSATSINSLSSGTEINTGFKY